MLIFFIHGVSTRNAQYSSLLEKGLEKRFDRIPSFHSSFWGNVYAETSKLWNSVNQDLKTLDPEQFQHKDFRQGYFSLFIGDAFTYLNSNRGARIRRIIADQLKDFIAHNPHEKELHLIAHSLGTVILWDILFSNQFEPDDAAFEIREILKGSTYNTLGNQITLKSITTMGSPIPFFNIMLGITSKQINSLSEQYFSDSITWLNIINASDILAYPIKPIFNEINSSLKFKDYFIVNPGNPVQSILKKFENNFLIEDIIKNAQVVVSAASAHRSYWEDPTVADVIRNHILNIPPIPQIPPITPNLPNKIIDQVINRLNSLKSALKEPKSNLNDILTLDQPLLELRFKDGSGILKFTKNVFGIHHIYILDSKGSLVFVAYSKLRYVERLQQEIEIIRQEFC